MILPHDQDKLINYSIVRLGTEIEADMGMEKEMEMEMWTEMEIDGNDGNGHWPSQSISLALWVVLLLDGLGGSTSLIRSISSFRSYVNSLTR